MPGRGLGQNGREGRRHVLGNEHGGAVKHVADLADEAVERLRAAGRGADRRTRGGLAGMARNTISWLAARSFGGSVMDPSAAGTCARPPPPSIASTSIPAGEFFRSGRGGN